VKSVAESMIKNMKIQKNWEINVINDINEFNAFVLPNGSIFVYTGLLKQLDNCDELAITLGHELSHVYLRHFAVGLSLSLIVLSIVYGFQYLLIGSVFYEPKYLIQLIFTLPQSRRHEIEADTCGTELAINSGYNIKGALSLFKKFDDVKAQSDLEQEVSKYFSTHPISKERIDNIKEKSKNFEKI